MQLIITEKPSVAITIAKVLGITRRCSGYIEGPNLIISWCIGHLVEPAEPEAYDAKYAKWRREDLPILPERWQYEVLSRTKDQFSVLKELMDRPDVTEIVNACDAGREGELIFRLVYQQAECTKPILRLWINSMEDAAIREGFEHLRPGSEYDRLYQAALCRERADWIVGINATRLFSCLYGQTLNIGRVMTPTLAMAAERDAAISGFVPEPFYTVELIASDVKFSSERISDRGEAETLAERCRQAGMLVITKCEQTEKHEKPPALYDLTTLQRDANRLLGFTAKQTLDYAQSLYEKKLITYPRTDSRYLTDDMANMLPEMVSGVQNIFNVCPERPAPVNAAQVVNSKKVSDHHAIIPTRTSLNCDLKALPAGEREILQLTAVRLICAVGQPFVYKETTVEAECAGETFKAKGKTVLDRGWKVYAQDADKDWQTERQELPDYGKWTELQLSQVTLKDGMTTPPKRFNEDRLLNAMENAGKEEMPEEAERRGIGTPATRAGIIEKLVKKGYLERVGSGRVKHLTATERGKSLITVVPEQLQSPLLTAKWENRLLQVEHGELDPEEFMAGISEMISDLVTEYRTVEGMSTLMNRKNVVGICPHCGSEVLEGQKGWFCSNRQCRFALWKDNGFFKAIGQHLTGRMVERILRDGRIHLKECVSQRTGKAFDADLLIRTEEDGRAKFELEFGNNGGRTKS